MIKCYFENGKEVSLRHVTVDGLVIDKNKILLVKRAPHLSNPNKYCLPGGFLDRDETTSEGVKREVLEETGYEVKDVTLFKVVDNPHRKGEDRQNVGFLFIVKVGEKINESDEEVEEVVWFDLDKLPQEEDFAFDHFEQIQDYLNYQEESPKLPFLD